MNFERLDANYQNTDFPGKCLVGNILIEKPSVDSIKAVSNIRCWKSDEMQKTEMQLIFCVRSYDQWRVQHLWKKLLPYKLAGKKIFFFLESQKIRSMVSHIARFRTHEICLNTSYFNYVNPNFNLDISIDGEFNSPSFPLCQIFTIWLSAAAPKMY